MMWGHPARDWRGDTSYENGNYLCRCCSCGEQFIGHKRRVTCRQCSNSKDADEGQDMRLESIGPTHPMYVHWQDDFIQVAVWGSARLIAIFTGPHAKWNADAYIKFLHIGDSPSSPPF